MMTEGAVEGVEAMTPRWNVPAKRGAHAKTRADLAQRDGATSGVAAELVLEDRVFVDVSGSARGAAPRVLHPKVVEALDAVPEELREPWHGECAEPGCISQALDAGLDPAKGTSTAVRIRRPGHPKHATHIAACSSCRALLEWFGILY